MTSDKKLRIEFKIVFMLFFISLVVCGLLWWEYEHQQKLIKEHQFMMRYLAERAVFSVERWAEYFELDKWMVFNLIITESNGDQYARSSANCMGYLQLAKSTADACKTRLYELIKWKKYNLFTTDINIGSGCLHLANLRKYFECDTEKKLIQVYNAGAYNYQLGKRVPKHTKRYFVNKTFFDFEFKKWR